jgi:hypothetical protein
MYFLFSIIFLHALILEITANDSWTQTEKDGAAFSAQNPSAVFMACEGEEDPICRVISGLSLKKVSVSCDDPFVPIEFRFKNKLRNWEKDSGNLIENGQVFLKTKPKIKEYKCPPLRK